MEQLRFVQPAAVISSSGNFLLFNWNFHWLNIDNKADTTFLSSTKLYEDYKKINQNK